MIMLCDVMQSFFHVPCAFEVSGEWHRRVMDKRSRFPSQHFLFKKGFGVLGSWDMSTKYELPKRVSRLKL